MSISPIVKQFDALTRLQILALRPGVWSDEDLVEVMEHFESGKKDRDRAMAVAELILHSPLITNVDYFNLYLDLIGYYRWKNNFPAALRWMIALITFDEQHEDGMNHAAHVRDLGEIYLKAGDLNTGLGLFTRLAQASPDDIWDYNALGFSLPRAGLPGLALEVLDRALALIAKNDPEQLKKQLTHQHREIAESLPSTPDLSSEISAHVLADFRAALLPPVSPTITKPSGRKVVNHYLPPITRLLNLDPVGDAALEAEIVAQGKVLLPELIQLAFDEKMPALGAPTHAIRLLRQLRAAQAAELGEISFWLDRASGDWRKELLTQNFAKIGGYTTSELETIVADSKAETSMRISALEALAERVKRLPALRQRFIDFIRTLLTRPEADTPGEELIVGFLISDALDLEARELYPEIARAFSEDRVDTLAISPLDVQHHWGLLPAPAPEQRQDGMYLRLRCTACNRVREHFVQNVLLELNSLELQRDEKPTAYDPYIMDHEITCPRCAAVDHYAMTSEAHTALLVYNKKLDSLTDLISGKKTISDLPPNPRVHPFRSKVLGELMHPLAGLEEYRRRITTNPKDAKLYMRMGNLLRTLYRKSAALEAHRQAYTLNPNDTEIALALGFSEHDFGNPSAAKEMYERVLDLELRQKETLAMTQPGTFTPSAIEGLNLLKHRKPSAWGVPAYNPATGANSGVNFEAQTSANPSRKRHRRKGS